MIKSIAKGIILGVGLACAVNTPAVAQEWRFEAPKASVCVEDMACWRVWMGNGTAGAEAPLYMYLPEGEAWDKLAPYLGYQEA